MTHTTKFRISELSQSLKYSVTDGIFYALMFATGESYLSAFGVSLGMNSFMIGLLASLPLFVGSLSQLVGVRLMEKNVSRRKIIVTGVTAQATSWLIIAALPWIFSGGSSIQKLLICAVILYSIGGQIVVPAWTSLMGDLVPNNIRGQFFGTRNQIMGYFIITSFILVGFLLAQAKANNFELLAFSCVFLFSAIARFISAYFLNQHEDPKYLFNADDKFTLWQFLKRTRHSNFTRFVFFHAMLNFGFLVAAPFFVVYMLRDLHFTYWQYSLVVVSALFSNYMSMRLWGNLGDRYGNKNTLNVCAVYMIFAPALWLVSSDIVYLIIIQLFSGCAYAGIQIASMNFLLDAVSPGKRGRCAAFMHFITAIFVIAGSLTGAALIELYMSFSPELLYYGLTPIAALFLSASLIRLAAVGFLLPRFREVRQVEPLAYSKRFYEITKILPLASYTSQLVAGVFRNRLKDSEND